jgi:hypothetical protein
MLYEILKALHIVSVIAWMAGLLYLPRLFVYHADAEKGSEQSETFRFLPNVLPKRPVELPGDLARESTAGHLHTSSLSANFDPVHPSQRHGGRGLRRISQSG